MMNTSHNKKILLSRVISTMITDLSSSSAAAAASASSFNTLLLKATTAKNFTTCNSSSNSNTNTSSSLRYVNYSSNNTFISRNNSSNSSTTTINTTTKIVNTIPLIEEDIEEETFEDEMMMMIDDKASKLMLEDEHEQQKEEESITTTTTTTASSLREKREEMTFQEYISSLSQILYMKRSKQITSILEEDKVMSYVDEIVKDVLENDTYPLEYLKKMTSSSSISTQDDSHNNNNIGMINNNNNNNNRVLSTFFTEIMLFYSKTTRFHKGYELILHLNHLQDLGILNDQCNISLFHKVKFYSKFNETIDMAYDLVMLHYNHNNHHNNHRHHHNNHQKKKKKLMDCLIEGYASKRKWETACDILSKKMNPSDVDIVTINNLLRYYPYNFDHLTSSSSSSSSSNSQGNNNNNNNSNNNSNNISNRYQLKIKKNNKIVSIDAIDDNDDLEEDDKDGSMNIVNASSSSSKSSKSLSSATTSTSQEHMLVFDFLDEMMNEYEIAPNTTTFNIILYQLAKHGLMRECIQVFTEMEKISDVEPDEKTFAILMHCCSVSKNFEFIYHLLTKKMNIHEKDGKKFTIKHASIFLRTLGLEYGYNSEQLRNNNNNNNNNIDKLRARNYQNISRAITLFTRTKDNLSSVNSPKKNLGHMKILYNSIIHSMCEAKLKSKAMKYLREQERIAKETNSIVPSPSLDSYVRVMNLCDEKGDFKNRKIIENKIRAIKQDNGYRSYSKVSRGSSFNINDIAA